MEESPVQIRIYYSSNDQLLVYTATGHLFCCFLSNVNDKKSSSNKKAQKISNQKKKLRIGK